MPLKSRERTTAVNDTENDEFEEEDENDVPAKSSTNIRGGWAAAKKAISDSKSSDVWSLPEDEALIKFREDEPFASLPIHWVDQIEDGRRSFYCLKTAKLTCPLCVVGHKPRVTVYFNIALISDDGSGVEPRILAAAPGLSTELEEQNDSRRGPLSRHYWAVKRSGGGKKGKVSYQLNVVKEAELADEYEIDPAPIKAAIKAAKLYTSSFFEFDAVSVLENVVEEHFNTD